MHKYNSDKKLKEKDFVKINIQDSEDYTGGYQSSPMTRREGTLDELRKRPKKTSHMNA